MTTATRNELNRKGHEYSNLASVQVTPGMVLVYLKKARSYYQDAGRDDLVTLVEKMMDQVG